jgi:hypothetical protein
MSVPKRIIDEPAVRFGISTAVVLGTGGLIWWAAKSLFKNTVGEIKQQSAEKQTTTVGKAAYYAEQLWIAFNPSGNGILSDWVGDGTDEAKALETLKAIPDRKTYTEVQKAYKALYRRDLNTDLKSELTSVFGNEDYDMAIKILNSKK